MKKIKDPKKLKKCQKNLIELKKQKSESMSNKVATKEILQILNSDSPAMRCASCKKRCIDYWSITSPFNFYLE